MNTNDLYTEYARCIEMCRGTALEDMPWECVKNGCGVFASHPGFIYSAHQYIFAIAMLENKPVFVGDVIFDKRDTYSLKVLSAPSSTSFIGKVLVEDAIGSKTIVEINNNHFTWQQPEPEAEQSSEMKIINDLSHVANSNSLDTQCNMPDFIIGAYLYKSLQALMEANKANGEYFKLSAQEDEAKTQ